MNRFFVGVDLGQSHDYTAIAVVERAELAGAFDPVMFAYRKEVKLRLRFLERVELGTPYPAVVQRVRIVSRSRELDGKCQIAVDATGVGRPVVDLLQRERLGGALRPVMITSGAMETHHDGYFYVPKRDLITGLRVLLENSELEIAAGLEYGRELVTEMMEMKVKVSAAGNELMAAWREGTHDDLVFAVALACWAAKKQYPGTESGQQEYWQRPWR